jgi:hypothetical protein
MGFLAKTAKVQRTQRSVVSSSDQSAVAVVRSSAWRLSVFARVIFFCVLCTFISFARAAFSRKDNEGAKSAKDQWEVAVAVGSGLSWRPRVLARFFFLFLAPLFSLGEAGIVIFGTMASLRETFFLPALQLHLLCAHRTFPNTARLAKFKENKRPPWKESTMAFSSPQSCNRGLRIGLTL